jgi:hypothetical protein
MTGVNVWTILAVLLVIATCRVQCEEKQDSDLCFPVEISECAAKNPKLAQCCVKLDGNECCSEEDYFDQWPSLENSHAEPVSIVKSLVKLIGILIGAAIFVVIVCCVCCFCCPAICMFAKSGQVIRSNDPAYQDQQQQQQAPGYTPQNQGTPSQNQVYPPQNQGYPPQNPGYPPQQVYPPNPGYPLQAGAGCYPENPPPYSGPQTSEAPPLQTKASYHQQAAYNPSAP